MRHDLDAKGSIAFPKSLAKLILNNFQFYHLLKSLPEKRAGLNCQHQFGHSLSLKCTVNSNSFLSHLILGHWHPRDPDPAVHHRPPGPPAHPPRLPAGLRPPLDQGPGRRGEPPDLLHRGATLQGELRGRRRVRGADVDQRLQGGAHREEVREPVLHTGERQTHIWIRARGRLRGDLKQFISIRGLGPSYFYGPRSISPIIEYKEKNVFYYIEVPGSNAS